MRPEISAFASNSDDDDDCNDWTYNCMDINGRLFPITFVHLQYYGKDFCDELTGVSQG